MAGKVPEARLAAEAAVDEDVEAADAEQGRVALAAGEHVQRRVAESDVAHDVRRLEQVIQRDGRQRVGDVLRESGERGRLGGAQSISGIDGDLSRGITLSEPQTPVASIRNYLE